MGGDRVRIYFALTAVFFVWFTVVVLSGLGDGLGLWEYAEVCTPKDAVFFCWTGQK